jgi:hypothetical protein
MMTHLPITPRRVAPYVVGGATGAHILARMRHLSRQPAKDMPLHFFLLKNSDIIVALGGASVIIWRLAKHKPRQGSVSASFNDSGAAALETSLIASVVHELRQIFTSLLLGLGLINSKAKKGNTAAIPSLVKRRKHVVRRGIDATDQLERPASANGQSREYGA